MADAGSPSGGARPSHPGSSNVPRRLSYASVVTGAGATMRSGHFAQSASMSGSSYPPHYHPYSRDRDISGRSPFHQRGLSTSSQKPVIPPFWVPPYLEGSRYARRLQEVYEARVRALRDQDSNLSGPQTAIWGSQNTHRFAPSHRGMTYDIVESNPPIEDDLAPLPTHLNREDKHQGLELSSDGTEVKYMGVNGKDLEAASIRTDHPMVPQCGIYYYEMTLKHKTKDCTVAIGFSTSAFSLERLPGWEPSSWAYHGDDGKVFGGQHPGRAYRSGFTQGDTIGCGVDFVKGSVFFTKNGHDLGTAFKDVTFPSSAIYPCIGMKKISGVSIAVNLGHEPFMYNIKDRVDDEEEKVAGAIAATSTQRLRDDNADEASFMQELVAQFLSHGGYIETARAFSAQVQRERKTLYGEESNLPELQNPHSSDAAPRQSIRQAILSGDIDEAIALTEQHFPGVLESQPHIVFQLKCRKFLEIILKAATVDKARDPQHKKSTLVAVEDVFDQPMELDEDSTSFANGNGKAPEQDLDQQEIEYNKLSEEAVHYGRKLRQEFQDASPEQLKFLDDMASLIPYSDPVSSQNGHLLDQSGRTKVAEELNSAILSFLDRAPTAAIETIWRQTEALIEVLSQDGSPACFINLQAEVQER